jgi:hypothetical protein
MVFFVDDDDMFDVVQLSMLRIVASPAIMGTRRGGKADGGNRCGNDRPA